MDSIWQPQPLLSFELNWTEIFNITVASIQPVYFTAQVGIAGILRQLLYKRQWSYKSACCRWGVSTPLNKITIQY